MKNVLLLVHDDDGQEARLQTALDLTRALDGHLTCVDVTVLPVLVADLYGGADQALLVAEEKAREAQHKTAIEGRIAHEDVPWDWIDITGDMVKAIVDKSMLADLIVLNRKLDESAYPDMSNITGRIVIDARVPVVAVPEGLQQFKTGRAFIAWDGSASCASAVRACIPLLRLASEVCIFNATEKADDAQPEAAAAYLSRHGIHAGIRTVERHKENADDLIAQESARWDADYVLMGAYSHGWLRETFGGVTKRMLSTSKVPLVLAH